MSQPYSPSRRGWLVVALLTTSLLGCTLARAASKAPPTPIPSPTPAPSVTPDTDWQTMAPGIERRHDQVRLDSGVRFTAILARVDPTQVALRVHYSPGAPLRLDEWRARLPEAALIVNGGFFDAADHALGLVVSNGQAFGRSFSGFGGMLQVDGAGTRVRSLVGEPYMGEPLLQAVQAFPMLIEVGGAPAPHGDGFREVARRTVVAQDRAGRILFVVVPGSFVSFADLQAWLLAGDLDLWAAFALDGGRSTGMYLAGVTDEMYPAFDQLPVVIAAYAP